LLADIEGMLQPRNFDPLTASMTIRIASTDYALRAVVVPFLSALRVQAPNIRVSVQPVDQQELQNQLDRGVIDLALVTPEAITPGLHAIALIDESYVCVMRADHPDALNSMLPLDRFCALDHALVSPTGGGFHGVTDEALEKLGRSRRVTVSVTSFLVLPEILMYSDLIAVVPRRLAVHNVGLRLLEPPVEIPGFRKTLAWHERTQRDAGHRWVRTLMVETIRTLD
jgi:DNA-binding transcriptional LysR family regulator